MLKQHIGLLGGTFDPVHQGHLHLASKFLEVITAVDQEACVHLTPCYVPAHRAAAKAHYTHRVAMLERALKRFDGLLVDPCEGSLPTPSYSINTILSLRQRFPESQIILSMGIDVFDQFCRWHRWQDVLDNASLLICSRAGQAITNDSARQLLCDRQVPIEQNSEPGQISRMDIEPIDVSSGMIRRLIAEGETTDLFLPKVVRDYIDQHKLYRA